MPSIYVDCIDPVQNQNTLGDMTRLKQIFQELFTCAMITYSLVGAIYVTQITESTTRAVNQHTCLVADQ